jgi:hypothetical protein
MPQLENDVKNRPIKRLTKTFECDSSERYYLAGNWKSLKKAVPVIVSSVTGNRMFRSASKAHNHHSDSDVKPFQQT